MEEAPERGERTGQIRNWVEGWVQVFDDIAFDNKKGRYQGVKTEKKYNYYLKCTGVCLWGWELTPRLQLLMSQNIAWEYGLCSPALFLFISLRLKPFLAPRWQCPPIRTHDADVHGDTCTTPTFKSVKGPPSSADLKWCGDSPGEGH